MKKLASQPADLKTAMNSLKVKRRDVPRLPGQNQQLLQWWQLTGAAEMVRRRVPILHGTRGST
jgi:hypothetical protein